jgi:hypothetical protein
VASGIIRIRQKKRRKKVVATVESIIEKTLTAVMENFS